MRKYWRRSMGWIYGLRVFGERHAAAFPILYGRARIGIGRIGVPAWDDVW